MPPVAGTLRVLRAGLGPLLAFLLLLAPLAARAQDDNPAIEKITALNKRALDAYDNLEFEDARKLLKQALDLCTSAGLDKHPIAARTHVHMGVVLIAAKQQELGIKQFKKAIEIQPDIQVTKSMANPEIMQAFEDASSSMPPPSGGDTGGGGTEPPAGGGGPPPPPQPAADIAHAPITKARKGRAIPITVTVSPDLSGYTKMVLAYRAEGGDDFEGVDMQRSGNKFVGEIPAEAAKGNHLHYYVEAEAADDSAVASTGTEEKPYFVSLSLADSGGGRRRDDDGGGGGDDDDVRLWFIGVAGGSGFGYATGNGEVNADNKVSPGLAPSTAAQIIPEVGYFVTPSFRLSGQIRYQFVSGTTPLNLKLLTPPRQGCGSDQICTPATSALAVFARGSWFFGSSTVRPYVSLAAGAGQIRHVVKFTSLTSNNKGICGMNGGEICSDTVVSGPVFGGGGAGLMVNLSQMFGLVAEANTLFGLPNFTIHVDLNAGIAARF